MDEEVIDRINHKPEEPVYLKRSATIYKIYAGLIIFSILMSTLAKPLMTEVNVFADLMDLLIGLPLLAMFVLSPLGLLYSWKSYKRKEGRSSVRFKYMLGHLFFCILSILIMGMFISDIAMFLSLA